MSLEFFTHRTQRDPRQYFSGTLSDELPGDDLEALSAGHAKLVELEHALNAIIFNRQDEMAMVSSALLVPVQEEPWSNAVSTILIQGEPGGGKTTLGSALGPLLGRPTTVVGGLGDMLPSALIGRYKHETGLIERGHVGQGDNPLMFDELLRANPAAQSSFANILSSGMLDVPGMDRMVPIAPEGEMLVVPCTTNPVFERGMFAMGAFLADRIIICVNFLHNWADRSYARNMGTVRWHWERAKARDVDDTAGTLKVKPVFDSPRALADIVRLYRRCTLDMEAVLPEQAIDYVDRLHDCVVRLTENDWQRSVPPHAIPPSWREAGELPRRPLVTTVSGRVKQHFVGMALAHAFLQGNSLELTAPAAQAVFGPTYRHGMMYQLGSGAGEIIHRRDADHPLAQMRITDDIIDMVLRAVPLHSRE